jgi:hypothetical protein
MTDRFTAIIGRPVRPQTPLDIQASWLRHEALDAMQVLGVPDVSSLKLVESSAEATLFIGGTPGDPGTWPKDAQMVSLWQHNMFAALFTADGTAEGAEDRYDGEMDLRKGRFDTARVERGL